MRKPLFQILCALGIAFGATQLPASVTIFGPRSYNVAAGQQTTLTDTIDVPASACATDAAVYTLVIANGNGDGTGRVKNGSITINGQSVADFGAQDASLERPVILFSTNSIALKLLAPDTAPAAVTITVRRQITTPSFDKSYTITDKSGSFNDTFSIGPDQSGPFTLILVNGGANLPVDDVDVTLNGAKILTKADIESRGNNDSVQTLARSVSVLASNTLNIVLKANRAPATVRIRIVRPVVDATGPVITLANAQSQIVNSATVAVTGTVSDPTGAGTLTVNGVNADLALNGAFQQIVPLNPGQNTIALDATDCVGNHTIGQLIVLRDAAPPQVGITTPANSALFGTATVHVTGTASDDIALASVVVNGQPVIVTAGSWSANVTFAPVNGTVDGSHQIVALATDMVGNQSSAAVAVTVDMTPPQITATVAPLPNAAGWHHADPTITFTCNDALSGVDTCTSPVVASGEGTATIEGVAVDRAGNRATVDVSIKLDKTKPTIRATTAPEPTSDGWFTGSQVTAGFVCNDDRSGVVTCPGPITFSDEVAGQTATGEAVDAAGNRAAITVPVKIDRTPPLLSVLPVPELVRDRQLILQGSALDAASGLKVVTCDAIPAQTDGPAFTCMANLHEGRNQIQVAAVDLAGNVTQAIVGVVRDSIAPDIFLESPIPNAITNAATFTVRGRVTDVGGVASLTVAGQPVTASSGAFVVEVPLNEGLNNVVVSATDHAGNVSSVTAPVKRLTVPSVVIQSPVDLALVRDASVTVRGTVTGSVSSVVVNGVAATLNGGSFTADVPLSQGRTVITADATAATGAIASANIIIYRDSIPPRLQVYSPKEGSTVYTPSISVTGMVDDIVVGTINAGQVRVTVNGAAAQVANRAFLLPDVPLAPGPNTLRITAIDQGGNSTVFSQHVTYAPAPPSLHLVAVSGSGQTAAIGGALPQPLVVRVVDAAGKAVGSRAVTFNVIENDGIVSSGATPARSVSVMTNAQGEASAAWTLGKRAGAGNNRVEARGDGLTGVVEFDATATTGTPKLIVADSGDDQFGIVGARLPRPLVAVVVDEGSNRLAGIPVTFNVTRGGGTFNGQPSIVVQTDSDGRAIATPALGSLPGQDNHRFSASVAGVTKNAVFKASGRISGAPEETEITGVVLDNTSVPVAGVSLRIEGTALTTQTNAQGQFVIKPAPVGYVKLIVDGSTAQRTGTWPMLEFSMYTLPGNDNNIGMPIYLLPVDVQRGLSVDESHGGTLTLPELPGFSLTIAPGSVTFPGGSRTGTVSVTLVHADKMPMTPGFGQQPKFLVTIQPPGAHFDPPAAITFPNVDGLAPGSITEMYSFDHDLGQFVAIGTGSVSADGTILQSDPGVGIIKGGWHCGGNPDENGTSASCPDCQKCYAEDCGYDPNKEGLPCKLTGACSVSAKCQSGNCVQVPKECPTCKKCDGGDCTADELKNGATCDDSNSCTTNDRCSTGVCKGDEVNTEQWHDISSITETMPSTILDAVNSFVRGAGLKGKGVEEIAIGASGRKKNCCGGSEGYKELGTTEVNGKFVIKVQGSAPIIGHDFDLGEHDIGGAKLELDLEADLKWVLDASLEAKGGHRENKCKNESCAFGSLGDTVAGGIEGDVHLRAACVTGEDGKEECLAKLGIVAAGKVPVTIAAGYNTEDCGTGIGGAWSAGPLTAEFTFEAEFLTVGLHFTKEWEVGPSLHGTFP